MRQNRTHTFVHGCLLLAAAFAIPAHAQTAASGQGGRSAYPPEYFSDTAPFTA